MHIIPSIFRKYDVRGVYPKEINSEVVSAIAFQFGRKISDKLKKPRPVILGHDPRDSSEELYRAAWQTLTTFPKLKVIPVGLVTTPMLYYLVGSHHAAGGLLITASHSPIEFNGLKAVQEAAVNISGITLGEWVMSTMLYPIFSKIYPVPKPSQNYYLDYANFLSKVAGKINKPLKVVVDCSNSPAGKVLKYIKIPKIKLALINTRPDGRFPAHGPNPLKPGALNQLKIKVKKMRADLGAALDGDADRAVFIDDLCRPVHPDVAAFLLMQSFKPPFVMDARVGWLVRRSKYRILLSAVGHTSVKKVIRTHDAHFGAETSGHFFFRNQFGKTISYNDSGLQAIMHALKGIARLKKKGESLSKWIDGLPRSYRGEVNYVVKSWPPIKARIEKAYSSKHFRLSRLDGVTIEDKNKPASFWFNLRPSNTEPILRLSIEARGKDVLEQELKKLERIIRPLRSERQGVE